MAPVSKEPSEVDILLNRVNVALARSQRLIASWLPQNTSDESTSTNTQEKLPEADDELFQPDSELLGVGAIAAGKSSNGAVRKEATALDLLRRQILGKKAGSTASNPSKSFGQASLAQRTTTKTSVHSPATIDAPSEDEEGRATAVFAKVRARSESSKGTKFSEDRISIKTQCRQEVDDDVDNMNLEVKPRLDNSAKASPANSASTKRKSANFLDEILAEKANRKKRRKKKHNEDIDKEAIA